MPILNAIHPCFPVADIGATMCWYEQKLGFKGDHFPEAEPYVFAILRHDHIEIMLQRLEGYQKPDLYELRPGGVWDVYIRMVGVKDFYQTLRGQVEIVRPLELMVYGQWEFEVKDPNGYLLVFSEAHP